MLRLGSKKALRAAASPARCAATRSFSTSTPRSAQDDLRTAKPDLLSELRKAPRPRMILSLAHSGMY